MNPREMFEKLGPRATTSVFERRFYARDLAYVPDVLLNLLVKNLPDAVARPANAAEVVEVMRYASANGVPVVARGGGSTAYANVVPSRAGLVLDLTGLQGVGDVDRETSTVTVEAGLTWWELERRLQRQGYALCAYPSSARAATVGGWFAMGGLGIGSLRAGPLVDQVEAAEVVLASGKQHRLTPGTPMPLDWFASSEGTLGVVTSVQLRVRKIPEDEGHFLVRADDVDTLVRVAQKATSDLGDVLFNLHLNSGSYNRILATLGHDELASGRATLAIDLDGNREAVSAARGRVASLVEGEGAELMDEALAQEEWSERFHSLRIKRARPAVLGAELELPLAGLAPYLARCEQLGSAQGLSIGSYGHFVAPDRVLIMSLYATDERNTLRYIMDTSLLQRLYAIGAEFGGKPYAIGLWNTPYLNLAFDADTRRERLRRKAELDPKGILNPGKSYRAPLLFSAPVFKPGMTAVRAVRRLFAPKEAAS